MPSVVTGRPLISFSLIIYSPLPKFRRSLNVHIDAGRKVDTHESVNRLRRRVEDVNQALVRAHLEVLARVLVLMGRTNNGVYVLFSGQRHRSYDSGTRTGDRLDDLARRRINRLVVIGLEPNADFLSRHANPLPRSSHIFHFWRAVGIRFILFSITLSGLGARTQRQCLT